MEITELTLEAYPQALALMRRTPGIGVTESDTPEATERYLRRNPGMSFIAVEAGAVVGLAMSGHDGRRGYLQHVVVEPAHRRSGVAQALVARCLERLRAEGIIKVHLATKADNAHGVAYWTRRGWTRRDDLHWFSLALPAESGC
jgi:N-acetylglutamate synthase